MKKRRTNYLWPFIDIVFNSLFLFIVLFALTVTKLRKEDAKKKEVLETDGLYAVVITWPAEANDDVDLYVKDPSGHVIFYGRPVAELMHLEYDDRGDLGDRAMTSSGEVKVDINRERAIIRGAMPGEYVVNVHMYTKRVAAPTPVKVSLYRLKGDDTEILSKDVTLRAQQDEVTAFRFVLGADGEMTGSNATPISLIREVTASSQQGGMSFPGGTFP